MISSGNWVFHQHSTSTVISQRRGTADERLLQVLPRGLPQHASECRASWLSQGCVACWPAFAPQKKSFAEETSHSKLSLLGLRYVEFFFCKGQHNKWSIFGSPLPVDILDWGTIFWKGLRTKYPGDQMWSHSILSNLDVIRPYLNSDQSPLKWTQFYIGIHRLYIRYISQYKLHSL